MLLRDSHAVNTLWDDPLGAIIVAEEVSLQSAHEHDSNEKQLKCEDRRPLSAEDAASTFSEKYDTSNAAGPVLLGPSRGARLPMP